MILKLLKEAFLNRSQCDLYDEFSDIGNINFATNSSTSLKENINFPDANKLFEHFSNHCILSSFSPTSVTNNSIKFLPDDLKNAKSKDLTPQRIEKFIQEENMKIAEIEASIYDIDQQINDLDLYLKGEPKK